MENSKSIAIWVEQTIWQFAIMLFVFAMAVFTTFWILKKKASQKITIKSQIMHMAKSQNWHGKSCHEIEWTLPTQGRTKVATEK